MTRCSVPAGEGVEQIVELLAQRPPTLGAGRLVCVDGPAGSGKTTLAAALSHRTGAAVVHLDDLYDGWRGLPRVDHQLGGLLRPLAEGRPGQYRRFDWDADRYAETVVVAPAPLLILEGVGAGSPGHADLITVLAWVEAPHDLRLQRGLERDGPSLADHWRSWAVDEAARFARDRTRDRSDVLMDGAGAGP